MEMNRIVFSRQGGIRPILNTAAVAVAVPALLALRPEIAPQPVPDDAGGLLAETAVK
jgi:hypothetical protein